MRLLDAIVISKNQSASLLILADEEDPCFRGTGTMIFFIWTAGHTVPLTTFGKRDEQPSEDDQDQCACGDFHGFPDDRELLYRLHVDNRWNACFPLRPLEALAAAGDTPADTKASNET